jgi:hypothetical protein
MCDQNNVFEMEVFRQVNEHLRATERKYWLASGAYISLFVIFINRLTEADIILATPAVADVFSAWKAIATHFFIGMFGLVVYLMQNWYRAWKEHYLDVLYEIRLKAYPDENNKKYLPYWLQENNQEQPLSVDNSLKLIIFLINIGFSILVCVELMSVFSGSLGISLGIGGVVLFLVAVWIIEKTISKGARLNA